MTTLRTATLTAILLLSSTVARSQEAPYRTRLSVGVGLGASNMVWSGCRSVIDGPGCDSGSYLPRLGGSLGWYLTQQKSSHWAVDGTFSYSLKRHQRNSQGAPSVRGSVEVVPALRITTAARRNRLFLGAGVGPSIETFCFYHYESVARPGWYSCERGIRAELLALLSVGLAEVGPGGRWTLRAQLARGLTDADEEQPRSMTSHSQAVTVVLSSVVR